MQQKIFNVILRMTGFLTLNLLPLIVNQIRMQQIQATLAHLSVVQTDSSILMTGKIGLSMEPTTKILMLLDFISRT